MHTAIVATENLLGEDAFNLGEAESRHLASVLRVAPGDALTILDGRGRRREAIVDSVGKRGVTCQPHGGVETLPRPVVPITLFQCVAKQNRMDWLVEKAAELGVARLVPIVSARAVARPASGEKSDRWQRIAESALRQSGSGWIMQVDAPLGRLWVLGYSGVSVFDARTLVLQRFIPLEGAHLSSMRLEGERVRLFSASGEAAGEIDRRGGALGLLAAGVTENVLERAGIVVPGKAVN